MKTGKQNQGSSRNGFITALLCSVSLAFLFPSPGAKGGWMRPELLNNAGVALILFVLATGVPLAHLIFGAKANLGLILMPILFYHPFQLFVCWLLASCFSNQSCDVPVGETSPTGQT